MPAAVTRILSDLHYGEHVSRVSRLDRLRPLLTGADRLVFNGDTLDTRPSRNESHSAACRAEVENFVRDQAPTATFITGNHDADISACHHLELAHGAVFVTHGDILFDNIVPWSRDAAEAGRRIAAERAREPVATQGNLERWLEIHRRGVEGHGEGAGVDDDASVGPPPNPAAVRVARDDETRRGPVSAGEGGRALRQRPPGGEDEKRAVGRPQGVGEVAREEAQAVPLGLVPLRNATGGAARFIVTGHTHRRGIWRRADGRIVINTGS
ncbi:MAG: metallophosphoesterase, partial [Opitutaceae bacterium]